MQHVRLCRLPNTDTNHVSLTAQSHRTRVRQSWAFISARLHRPLTIHQKTVQTWCAHSYNCPPPCGGYCVLLTHLLLTDYSLCSSILYGRLQAGALRTEIGWTETSEGRTGKAECCKSYFISVLWTVFVNCCAFLVFVHLGEGKLWFQTGADAARLASSGKSI